MKKVSALITGGAGFIGSHIVEEAIGRGWEVTVLDNLSSGFKHNIAPFENRISFIEGDIRNYETCLAATNEINIVFHQAAIVSVPYSIEHPQETHDVNIQGTLNILKAAQTNKVKRVIFASSAAIYGNNLNTPLIEQNIPAPISPYGVEKITAEYYLANFNQHFGLETVGLRYFNVFGPRQDPRSPYSGVISIFTDRLNKDLTPTIFGDGHQSRDFVFVKDVVQANFLAAEHPSAPGNVYNVGSGTSTTLNQLLSTLAKIKGKAVTAIYEKERSGDIRDSLASISKISGELGYKPDTPIEEGLIQLLNQS